MPDNRGSTRGFLGLLGVGIAVCCGLPLLLGAGIAIGAAGLAVGSGIIVTLGVAAAVWGLRRRITRCDVPPSQTPMPADHDRTPR